VPLEYDPAFRVNPPRDVFRGPYTFSMEGRAWDAHPDGQRFLFLLDGEDSNASSSPERQRIHVIVNWREELQRRLPSE